MAFARRQARVSTCPGGRQSARGGHGHSAISGRFATLRYAKCNPRAIVAHEKRSERGEISCAAHAYDPGGGPTSSGDTDARSMFGAFYEG